MPPHLLGALVIPIVMQDRLVISCQQTLATELNRAISCSKELTIHVFYSCFFTGPSKELTLVWNGHLNCGRTGVERCAKAWLPASQVAEAVRKPGCRIHSSPGTRLCEELDWLESIFSWLWSNAPHCHALQPLLTVFYQFSYFYEQARTGDCR